MINGRLHGMNQRQSAALHDMRNLPTSVSVGLYSINLGRLDEILWASVPSQPVLADVHAWDNNFRRFVHLASCAYASIHAYRDITADKRLCGARFYRLESFKRDPCNGPGHKFIKVPRVSQLCSA
jgi:hypothetical protein